MASDLAMDLVIELQRHVARAGRVVEGDRLEHRDRGGKRQMKLMTKARASHLVTLAAGLVLGFTAVGRSQAGRTRPGEH
jgi:hypothetical protein